MALFFLVLSAVPCADSFNEVTDTDMLTEASDLHNHFGDDCSPFCACQCCQVQVTEFESLTFFDPIEWEEEALYFAYASQVGKEVYKPLFQPPKV